MKDIIFLLNNNFEFQMALIIFLGLFVGSFLNVLNYRLPIMQDYENAEFINQYSEKPSKSVLEILQKYKGFNFAFPSSACPSCNHKIKPWENIPIISYLFLMGKCSNCSRKISIEYPLIEFSNLALWVLAYFIFGFGLQLLFVLPLLSIFISLFVIDLKNKIIFDSYHLIIFSLGAFYTLYGFNSIDVNEGLLTSIGAFFVTYIFVVLYEKIRGFDYHMLGRGDIKMFGALGIWLGIEGFLTMLFLSSLIGLANFVLIKLINNVKDLSKYQMPYGPSIVIATTIILMTNLSIFNFVK